MPEPRSGLAGIWPAGHYGRRPGSAAGNGTPCSCCTRGDVPAELTVCSALPAATANRSTAESYFEERYHQPFGKFLVIPNGPWRRRWQNSATASPGSAPPGTTAGLSVTRASRGPRSATAPSLPARQPHGAKRSGVSSPRGAGRPSQLLAVLCAHTGPGYLVPSTRCRSAYCGELLRQAEAVPRCGRPMPQAGAHLPGHRRSGIDPDLATRAYPMIR